MRSKLAAALLGFALARWLLRRVVLPILPFRDGTRRLTAWRATAGWIWRLEYKPADKWIGWYDPAPKHGIREVWVVILPKFPIHLWREMP